jgi:hypothetical protein
MENTARNRIEKNYMYYYEAYKLHWAMFKIIGLTISFIGMIIIFFNSKYGFITLGIGLFFSFLSWFSKRGMEKAKSDFESLSEIV